MLSETQSPLQLKEKDMQRADTYKSIACKQTNQQKNIDKHNHPKRNKTHTHARTRIHTRSISSYMGGGGGGGGVNQ